MARARATGSHPRVVHAALASCAIVVGTVVVLPACEVIAGYTDSLPRPPDGDAARDTDASACPVRTGGDACARIPRFTATTQVIDGKGDEFCDIPATVFGVRDAGFKQAAVSITGYPETVAVRVAWSEAALHVHFHVTDPRILVSADDTALALGDAVVVYFASGGQLTGAFGGTSDFGATQIVVTPAVGTFPIRGYGYYYDPPARTIPLDLSLVASRLVPDGYEVEMKLPWSGAKDPASIRSGGKIGFNPGVVLKNDPASTKQELEIALALRPLAPRATTSCQSVPLSPWCDDRTWCLPTLE